MFERVKELTEFLEKDLKVKSSKVRFVYSSKDEDDKLTEWYGINDRRTITNKVASQTNHIYGYHIQTIDGIVFDFWFDGNKYHLVGLEIGGKEIPVEDDSVVYETKTIKLP